MASVVDVYYVKKNLEVLDYLRAETSGVPARGLQWLLSDSVARKY